jgi:hypothetical protein
VTGVINDFLGTFFSCTNVDSAAVPIGVEVFGPAGGAAANNAATSAINVAPGATVMFGTQTAAGVTVDAVLNPRNVTKGSGRIVATSKKIVCTTFVADTNANPPTSAYELTIIAKTKQQAANSRARHNEPAGSRSALSS